MANLSGGAAQVYHTRPQLQPPPPPGLVAKYDTPVARLVIVNKYSSARGQQAVGRGFSCANVAVQWDCPSHGNVNTALLDRLKQPELLQAPTIGTANYKPEQYKKNM